MKHLLAPLVLLAAHAFGATPPSKALRDCVVESALSTVGTEKIVLKWRAPPSVSVWAAEPEAHEIVAAAVRELQEPLALAKFGISLMAPKTETANIRFIFCSRDVFPQTIKQHDAQPVGDRDWGWYRWWDANRTIYKTVIVMSYEQGSQDTARRRVLRALYFALGPFGRMPVIRTGMAEAKAALLAGKLTTLDREFLIFFYRYLETDTRAVHVRRVFDKHWR